MLFITWKCFCEGFRLDNKTDCSMNLALPLAVIIYAAPICREVICLDQT